MNLPLQLPPGLVAYRQTPVFDEQTIPAGLLREHRTRPGTWAVIAVLEGRLRFRLLDPPSEVVLSAGERRIVVPEQPHEVATDGTVKFVVEFCRALTPASAPLQPASQQTDIIPGSRRAPPLRKDQEAT